MTSSRERSRTGPLRRLAVPAAILSAVLAFAQQNCRTGVEALLGAASNDTTEQFPQKPENYTPPQEGRIIEKRINNPAGKTVFFLSDEHVDPEGNPTKQQQGLQAQKQLYAIVRDLVEKYGHVPLILEGWPQAATFAGVESHFQNTPQDPSEDPQMRSLRKLFAESNLEQRQRMAESMIGIEPLGAGLALMAAYPDKITVYGSDSDPQSNTLQPAQDLENMVFAINHPEEISCPNTTQFNLAAALAHFSQIRENKKVKDCYCEFRVYVANTVRDFEQSRFIDAPNREIEVALGTNGSIAVVITGSNHAKEALRVLDSKGANAILVAPAVIATETADYAKNPHLSDVVIPPDDASGTCETWRVGKQAEYDAAIGATIFKLLQEE